MKNNLVLIGFMGTGKTAVGRRLARKLKMKFVDTDDDIEKVSGMSVGKIFSEYGEVRFRSEEKLAIKRASRLNNCVIATGGGAVLFPENLKELAKNGTVIALKATPEEIQKRVQKRNNFRPLLGNDKSIERITELLNQRKDLYEKADYLIDTTGKDLDEVVAEILEVLGKND